MRLRHVRSVPSPLVWARCSALARSAVSPLVGFVLPRHNPRDTRPAKIHQDWMSTSALRLTRRMYSHAVTARLELRVGDGNGRQRRCSRCHREIHGARGGSRPTSYARRLRGQGHGVQCRAEPRQSRDRFPAGAHRHSHRRDKPRTPNHDLSSRASRRHQPDDSSNRRPVAAHAQGPQMAPRPDAHRSAEPDDQAHDPEQAQRRSPASTSPSPARKSQAPRPADDDTAASGPPPAAVVVKRMSPARDLRGSCRPLEPHQHAQPDQSQDRLSRAIRHHDRNPTKRSSLGANLGYGCLPHGPCLPAGVSGQRSAFRSGA